MRTLVDIPEPEIGELTRLSQREHVSRAALIREAVRDLLARRRSQGDLSEFFGLWDERVDGVERQRRLRNEW